MTNKIPIRMLTAPRGAKGRQFAGVMPALAASRSLWEPGSRDTSIRPIMAVIAASSQEHGAVLANLREHGQFFVCGSGIQDGATWVAAEFPKRAGYHWSAPQPIPEQDAVATHVYEPGNFGFVPVVPDAARVGFVVMPALADLDEVLRLNQADLHDAHTHAFQLGHHPRDLQDLGITPRFIALAAVWAKTLQRRTIWAVPQKLAFRVQLLLACLKHGVVTMGDREFNAHHYGPRPWWNAGGVDFTSIVHPAFGMHTGVATRVKSSALEDILAEEVSRFDYMRRKKPAAVYGAPAVTMGRSAV